MPKNTATKSTSTLIDQIFAEVAAFEKLCTELRDYGAADSEPDGVFQRLINAASCGEGPDVPRSGNTWELYSHSMDCSAAAEKLHDQALKVVRLIESCPVREFAALRERIKKYCWRLY